MSQVHAHSHDALRAALDSNSFRSSAGDMIRMRKAAIVCRELCMWDCQDGGNAYEHMHTITYDSAMMMITSACERDVAEILSRHNYEYDNLEDLLSIPNTGMREFFLHTLRERTPPKRKFNDAVRLTCWHRTTRDFKRGRFLRCTVQSRPVIAAHVTLSIQVSPTGVISCDARSAPCAWA